MHPLPCWTTVHPLPCWITVHPLPCCSHNDTYAESFHRDFFANYAKGVPPEKCAEGTEGHNTAQIGGFVVSVTCCECKKRKKRKLRRRSNTPHINKGKRGEGATSQGCYCVCCRCVCNPRVGKEFLLWRDTECTCVGQLGSACVVPCVALFDQWCAKGAA